MSQTGFVLDAYPGRIGLFDRPADPLALLREVVARHTARISFENVDVFLGQPVRFDPAWVAGKMVVGRRGGYCFEQNGLLAAALTVLGYAVTPLLARVVRGMSIDAAMPRSHMMLRVELPQGPFLADGGSAILPRPRHCR